MIQGPGHLEAWCVASGDPHAYYARLLTHPKCARGYSFRDDAELDRYKQSKVDPRNITFDPSRDADIRRQDAAKVFVRWDETSISNQERFPLGYQAGKSLLATWDYWYGREWAFSHTSMANSKNFNLGKPADASHLLWQTHFQAAAPGTLALVDLRGPTPDVDGWPGATLPPVVRRYVQPETWCRAWLLITPNADGTWHTRAWWADEQQSPADLYEGRLVRFQYPPAGEALGKFWLEYATSQNAWNIPHVYDGGTPDSGLCIRRWADKQIACAEPSTDPVHVGEDRGPLVAYARNLAILIDISEDEVIALLEQPKGA